jgi:hypothetical protein
MIAKIATGEIEDITSEDDKNTDAGAHGRQGAGGWPVSPETGELQKRRPNRVGSQLALDHVNFFDHK